jgi:hypothetical protein
MLFSSVDFYLVGHALVYTISENWAGVTAIENGPLSALRAESDDDGYANGGPNGK